MIADVFDLTCAVNNIELSVKGFSFDVKDSLLVYSVSGTNSATESGTNSLIDS
jgi:hypothetical protein